MKTRCIVVIMIAASRKDRPNTSVGVVPILRLQPIDGGQQSRPVLGFEVTHGRRDTNDPPNRVKML